MGTVFSGFTNSPPPSQTGVARPISFFLTIDGTKEADVDLFVRPEDLQWTEPSRTSVMQTIGGAWTDNFGAGVPTITLSGHTGWRPDGAGKDWETRFDMLYEQVFKKYHAGVAEKKDPEKVVLELVDVLDKRAAVVVPHSFVLKRNRSRPLLKQYNISLTQVKWSSTATTPKPDTQSMILKALRLIAKAAATAAAWARLLIKDAASFQAYKVLELAYLAANTALVAAGVLGFDMAAASSSLKAVGDISGAASNALRMSPAGASPAANRKLSFIASQLSSISDNACLVSAYPGAALGSPCLQQSIQAMQSTKALAGCDPVLAPMLPEEVLAHCVAIMAGTRTL